MGQETALPKNVRQIGDVRGPEKICLEDYVMTYIRKKEPQEDKGYLGIFLGERQEREDATYLYIRGILDVFGQENPEEKGAASDAFEKEKREYFPEWDIVGCCVIGAYPTRKLELLEKLWPESGNLIYHQQEQEESLYLKTQGEYRKIKGYFVFYEQNRKMQDYLSEKFGEHSVEKESQPDLAIKSFRTKVKEKSEQKNHSMLKLAGSFFALTILAIGAITVNRLDELRSEDSLYTGSIQTATETGEAISTAAQAGEETGTAAQTGEVVSTAAQADETDAADTASAWMLGSDSFWEDTYEDDDQGDDTAVSTSASGDTAQDSADTAATNEAAQDSTDAAATDEAVQNTAITASIDETAQDAAAAASADEVDQNVIEETAAADQTQQTASRQIQSAYVIRQGDTLATICKKYYGNLDRLEELCLVNEIDDADVILPGQKIVLP